VRTLEEVAVVIDELGRRLLAGETVVALSGDELAADVVEHLDRAA
jgi:hypothetical protein